MKNILITISLATLLLFSISSCKKNDAGLPPYDVKVTLNNSGAHFITDTLTVNPKDSLYFDFTITSAKTMKYVSVQKNGTDISRDTLYGAVRNTFSAVKRFMADSSTGVYTYRFMAKDSAGVFLGDKTVVVNVASDFTYYTAKTLFVPDSTAKTNLCYFATSTGQTFSYSTGAANSALIDFGYFYDTTTVGLPKHTIYALTNSPFAPYDLTAWTKNATVFKKMPTSVTFATITSAGQIRTLIATNFTSGTVSKVATLSIISGNNVIGFRTAAGKIGLILIGYIKADSPNATSFINIEEKIVN